MSSSIADNVIEAHGYSMKFKLTIVSIHLAKVQLVQRFASGGFHQLQNSFYKNSFVTVDDLRGLNILIIKLRLRECSLSSI